MLMDFCASDPDPEVKRHTLEGLTAIRQANQLILESTIDQIKAFAFQEVIPRPELVKSETMADGSTLKLDNGIPIRRAAYSFLLTLYNTGSIDSSFVL